MKALFGMAEAVPLSRVARDYRPWLIVLAIGLTATVAALILLVLPLSASADATAARAARAEQTLAAARAELKAAEQTRDGSAQAAKDLDRFYKEILPRDLAAAQWTTQLWLATVARNNGVMFQQSTDRHAEVRDSTLTKVTSEATLSGTYRDIRKFLYALESAPQFVIIEEVQLGDTGTSAQQNARGELEIAIKASTYFVRTP